MRIRSDLPEMFVSSRLKKLRIPKGHIILHLETFLCLVIYHVYSLALHELSEGLRGLLSWVEEAFTKGMEEAFTKGMETLGEAYRGEHLSKVRPATIWRPYYCY